MIDKGIEFKKAERKDVDLLFNWINDPEVRAQSLSTDSISYTEHTNWFNKKLVDKNCYLYIVLKEKIPIGMVRFDVNSSECTISYLVEASHRGKGFGTSNINKGLEKFIGETNFKGEVKAIVKKTNKASIKIFEKAGFKNENIVGNLIHFKKMYS